ncbi:MAG: hypothetical protein DMF63_01925 [Acidobacteria bacterium]|nr:MAG: hypothetical protein DMF63_01925 [Acidobacteriota bacterium]
MANPFCKFLTIVFVFVCTACSGQKNTPSLQNSSSVQTASETRPEATPSNKFTAADVAKLKWIEGTWRGVGGDKPFHERYKIEDTAMIVESLKENGSLDGEPDRFELKNGEFGKGEGEKRSAASEISETHVQFVPALAGKGNSFRFEHQSDGTWIALLGWPATADKPALRKLYRMEPWQPNK